MRPSHMSHGAFRFAIQRKQGPAHLPLREGDQIGRASRQTVKGWLGFFIIPRYHRLELRE